MKKIFKQIFFSLALLCVGFSAQAQNESPNTDERTDTQSEEIPEIFKEHSWLKKIVDFSDCDKEKVDLYLYAEGQFLVVNKDNANTMYEEDGSLYCVDTPEVDCVKYYELKHILDSWACEERDDK